MSADNGIYILVSPVENVHGKKIGEEARVIHATGIENINYDDGTLVDGFNPEQLTEYFKFAEPMTVDNAEKKAFEMAEGVANDEFCPVLEYGVCTINLTHPFSFYEDIMRRKMNFVEQSNKE